MKKRIKMESEILKREINEGHYLELMDRLYVLASTLHDHCLQHPLAEYDEEIYNSIEIALEATYDAYQLVGSKEFENENENNTH
jgi:hypothetical protein